MDRRNPYIEAFIRKLIDEKGEKLEPDARERLVEDLNRLLENMIGRNMIAALPDEVRSQFVVEHDKGARDVDVAAISGIFDRHIADPSKIIKKTLKEFADLYFHNR